MKTDRSTVPSSRPALSAWMTTLAATAASSYALDAVATAAGVLLVASGLLSGLDHSLVLAVLAATYVLWGVGLRANLRANWLLLRRTGTSTNVLSKAAFELTGRRGPRTQRVAAGAGYVATELAKEAPYYAGAFGAAALTNSVSSNDALLFLAGTNLGAAAYEYVLARLTRRLLRRPRCASFDTDWVPHEYLADYYRVVEPDERETIAFFADEIKEAPAGGAVLVFGTGPTLHHIFLAAPKGPRPSCAGAHPTKGRKGSYGCGFVNGQLRVTGVSRGGVGRAWPRRRLPGRHELKVRRDRPILVRLICEGWIPQDPCSSPGSHPKWSPSQVR